MKKFLLAAMLFTVYYCHGQNTNWFISFSTGAVFGGPSASLLNKMKQQGFNQTSAGYFLGLNWTTTYPFKSQTPYFKVLTGKKISENKSIYFTGGFAGSGEVSGYKASGNVVNLGFFAYTDGDHPFIKYTVYQLGGGLQYHFKKTRMKLGAAPSALLFSYSSSNGQRRSVCFSPGIEGMARMPLGREKKFFGVDLLAQVLAAAPVKPDLNKNLSAGETRTSFNTAGTSLLQASVGIAFSFRQ